MFQTTNQENTFYDLFSVCLKPSTSCVYILYAMRTTFSCSCSCHPLSIVRISAFTDEATHVKQGYRQVIPGNEGFAPLGKSKEKLNENQYQHINIFWFIDYSCIIAISINKSQYNIHTHPFNAIFVPRFIQLVHRHCRPHDCNQLTSNCEALSAAGMEINDRTNRITQSIYQYLLGYSWIIT